MQTFSVKLIDRIKRTASIESFRFQAKERIHFLAGQFLQVIFDPKNLENKELNKYLSFSSSPAREYIEVTKRLSESSFSQYLRNLKKGNEVMIKAPFGNCALKENYDKIAFLIGGIGITPVISILEDIQDKRLKTDVALFYSNRNEEEIAFKDEIFALQLKNHNLKIFNTVTDCQPQDIRCIFGRIDKNMLSQRLPDYQERLFFIFGPPKMVEAMNNMCLEMGISPEDIKTESFIGY